MPPRRRASSIERDCAFVRYSTAASFHPSPTRACASRSVRSIFCASSRSESDSITTTGSPSALSVQSSFLSCPVFVLMMASARRTMRCVER